MATSTPGGVQSFLFAGDTVARITWDAGTIPVKVNMHQYTGTTPPKITHADNHMYMYTTVDMPAINNYYALDLFYKDGWIGTNPSENDIRITRFSNMFLHQWSLLPSGNATDPALNMMSATFLSDTAAIFTGTDLINPLPVKLLDIKGAPVADDVYLNWTTASEINCSRFDVERSLDGKYFGKAGSVKAKGNSQSLSDYQFIDHGFLIKHKLVYYRLKIIDDNENYDYSDVVSVSRETGSVKASVFPNPYTKDVTVRIFSADEREAKIIVSDISGRNILQVSKSIATGNNLLQIAGMEELKCGVYFLSIIMNGETQVVKLVRE